MEDSVRDVDSFLEILSITGLSSVSICIRKLSASSLNYHLLLFNGLNLTRVLYRTTSVVVISMCYYISRYIRNGRFHLGTLLRHLKKYSR